MGASYLATRVAALRERQNPDGGWGYFPGKTSWLEPTLYAAMALHGTPEADRAWALVSAWQNPDGGFRPAAEVQISHAATALAVTTAIARGQIDAQLRNGVKWLVGTEGSDGNLLTRAALRVGAALGLADKDQRDLSLKGWPWKPDTASWVEPTAHAIVALKQAAATKIGSSEIEERVRMGEAQLMDVRCKDGGWNYGNRTARGQDLRSYPETTGIALVGLQGRTDLGSGFELAKKMLHEPPSPLATVWLTMAMRVNGIPTEEASGELSTDILITALEALGAADGNYALMKVAA